MSVLNAMGHETDLAPKCLRTRPLGRPRLNAYVNAASCLRSGCTSTVRRTSYDRMTASVTP